MYYNCKKFITSNAKTQIPKSIENFIWNIMKNFYFDKSIFSISKHTFSICPHPTLPNHILIYHYTNSLKHPSIYTYKNDKITIIIQVEYKNGYFIMHL